jgi:hypothetical protein
MLIPNKHNGYTRDGVRRVFFDGGGGGGGPQTSTQYTSTVPEWLKDEQKDIVARGFALGAQPYQPYTGERTSQFTPLQRMAFGQAESQQVAPQMGAATGITGAAALGGLGAQVDPYQTGQFTRQTAFDYMDPYFQNVVNIQQQAAQRQADIQATKRGAQAVQAGAFGGSRQAIENAEANRALMSQMGDIQARGLQDAFTRAQDQFNREQQMQEQSRQFGAGFGLQGLDTALRGAGQLGSLGQQQFGQEMDIMGAREKMGGTQQQQIQRILDQQYADFQAQRDFPYQQLGFMSDLIQGRGGSTRSVFSAPQPGAAQTLAGLGTAAYGLSGMMAKGGEVKGYADGGITRLLGDDQLQQVQSPMAQIAAQEEMMQRQAIRDQAPASMPRETDMTEAELLQAMQRALQEGNRAKAAVIQEIIEERRMADSGIAMIAPETVGDMPEGGLAEMAGGGMVSFEDGGGIRSPYTPRRTSGQRMLDDMLQSGMSLAEALAASETMGDVRGITEVPGRMAEGIASAVADTKALPMSPGYLTQRDRDEAARAARRQAKADRQQAQTRTMVPSQEVAVAPEGIAALSPVGITPSAARDAKLLERQNPMSGGVALALAQQKAMEEEQAGGKISTAGGPGPSTTSGGILAMLKAAGYDIDKMNADEIAAAARAQEARRTGIAQNRADLEQMIAARGVYGQEQEDRIKSEIEGFTGKKEDAKSMALFQAGLAILSADPSRGAFAAIGEGALKGVTAYKGDIEKLEEKRSKLNERLDRIADIRRQERFADDKDLLALKKEENMLTAEAEREAQEILRGHNIRRADVAKFAVQEDLKAREAAANRASRVGATDRLSLQALTSARVGLQAQLKAAQTAMDDEEVARLTAELNDVLAEIQRRAGVGSQPVGGGGKVATSAQLPAGFKLD